MEFWKINSQKYPILSILARRYLAIPATSVPSERIFSQEDDIITKKRNSLHSDTFKWIMCLKNWGIINDVNEDTNDEKNINYII